MSDAPENSVILLNVDRVSFAYQDQPVLREVSLGLKSAQVVSLIGPNGSGKSTLIKLCLGHLIPAQGQVAWEGKPVHQWTRRQLARRVAYLPQSPFFEPEQRVLEVLQLGRAPYWQAFGIESSADHRIVAEVAKLLELDDLLHRSMDQLSGGQRQRVFVGRCLVQEPKAMLLDEPSTFLDLRHQVELLQLLRRLSRERGIGVLMASHDLNLAGAFGDQLLLLDNGQVAAAGSPAQVLNPDLLTRVYGVPIQRIDRPEGPLIFPRV